MAATTLLLSLLLFDDKSCQWIVCVGACSAVCHLSCLIAWFFSVWVIGIWCQSPGVSLIGGCRTGKGEWCWSDASYWLWAWLLPESTQVKPQVFHCMVISRFHMLWLPYLSL